MKEKLQTFLMLMANLGGNTRKLVFKDPASEQEVAHVEKLLGYNLPADFKEVLLTMSAHCEFWWSLPDKFILPHELRQIFSGELHWGTDFILQFNQSKDGWVENVFPNHEDSYDKVWHNKFVFQKVKNGDFLAIDLSAQNSGKIVYLSHDDGDGHGWVMADSFYELLENWTQLGCVGAEDWQWLPFCENESAGIDPNCPNAVHWKRIIGMI
jgi:hypothetical protein